MSLRLRWSLDALADLEAIIDDAASQDRQLAQNIQDRILHTETLIITAPYFARYDSQRDLYERYIPRTRIILIYSIGNSTIHIVGAFHTSRSDQALSRMRRRN